MAFPQGHSFSLFRRAASCCRLLVVALALVTSSVLAADRDTGTSSADLSGQKARIVEIMKGLKLEPFIGKDKPLCKSFYDDFRKQTNIEYIAPLFTTDDYDDPRLKAYRDKCPKLELNKHRGFARVDPDEVLKTLREEGLPEDKLDEELDKYASSISYGTRNFKIYKVDLDNDPKNGEEYVFYDQDERTAKSDRYAGEPSATQGAGTYALVDFNACRIRGGVRVVEGFNDRDQPAKYHAVIRYEEGRYIFSFESTSTKPRYAHLKLEGLGKDRTGREKLMPFCAYSVPRDR